MRKILIVGAVLVSLGLTACVSPPEPITVTAAGSAKSGLTGFATVARWGGWEMELAPAYTRLAGLRHRAAVQLDARKISVTDAIAIQATADKARSALDRARCNDAGEPTPDQRAALAEAIALTDRAQSLLEQPQ